MEIQTEQFLSSCNASLPFSHVTKSSDPSLALQFHIDQPVKWKWYVVISHLASKFQFQMTNHYFLFYCNNLVTRKKYINTKAPNTIAKSLFGLCSLTILSSNSFSSIFVSFRLLAFIWQNASEYSSLAIIWRQRNAQTETRVISLGYISLLQSKEALACGRAAHIESAKGWKCRP